MLKMLNSPILTEELVIAVEDDETVLKQFAQLIQFWSGGSSLEECVSLVVDVNALVGLGDDSDAEERQKAIEFIGDVTWMKSRE